MRCNNQALMKLLSRTNLTQDTEVDFNLLENLPDCKKIKADKYIALVGTASTDPYRIPENRFECLRTGCINSGLLSIADNAGAASADYFLAKDAIDYAAGVLTFYVGDTNLPVTVSVLLSEADDFANADQYDVTIEEVGTDGFAPVVIDLSKTATQVGNGWTPAQAGTFIRISSTQAFGISSIAMFDSMSDFATNDVVKIRCLSGIDGSFDIPALEATCTSSGYDTSGTSGFDFTITGRLMSANYEKLNPIEGRGSAVDGFDMTTVEKEVGEHIDGAGRSYGRITLADAYQNECGFMSVQMADACDVTNAGLIMLTIPTLVDVDGGHYQVIKNNDGTTDLIFNEQHIGRKVLVSYPVTAEVVETVGSMDNVGNVRVRMSYPREYSDGSKYRLVYNNVLVTSFPAGITNTDEDISFTINVQRDSDGLFYHKYRILA